MQVKTFRGRTMAETLAQVKRELGPEAVILHTRTFHRRRWLKRVPVVEITASRDVRLLEAPRRRLTVTRPDGSRRMVPVPSPPAPPAGPDHLAALKADLAEVKHTLNQLVQRGTLPGKPDLPEGLLQVYLRLVQNQVAEGLAADIVRRLRRQLSPGQAADPREVRRRLLKVIESHIHAGGAITLEPGRTRVVALVGPTGVGKTTTIAKLAAEFALRRKARVALVSIDTYRIAAPEQLRIYADILDLPLRIALTPEDLRRAVNDLAGENDLILIDTAGRSQHDLVKLNELKRFLAAAQPDEIHLVVSTVAGYRNILSVIERFSVFNFDKLILSKLDEAVNFGIILSVVAKVDRRLSYITTGQDVPDDIEAGCAERLAQLILKESLDNAGPGSTAAGTGITKSVG